MRIHWGILISVLALGCYSAGQSSPPALDTVAPKAGPDTAAVVHAAHAPEGGTDERLVSLVRGPGIEIFAPTAGAVMSVDRVYVGVKGEPGAALVLYDGATPIDSGHMRIDGVFDFIAVPLGRGPHRLRVAMRNSWNQERWDSIAVHVTGLPARFEAPSRATLVADGRSAAVVDVRVLDRWGVPVAQPAYVTVSAQGAQPSGRDADPSSVGLQLLSTATGRLAKASARAKSFACAHARTAVKGASRATAPATASRRNSCSSVNSTRMHERV